MAAAAPVVVVGSANMDLFCYMARFPKPHETIHGRHAAACCGGKGSNQCVMAARMGAPTSMVAKLGRDGFGAAIRAAWEADGVDIRHVGEASDGTATGQAQIWVDDDGTNSMVFVAGANAELSPEDVRAAESLIAGAAVVVCQLEVPRATTLEALRLARKHGVRSILNLAPAAADLEPECLRLASIVCPNETELSVLTGHRPVGTDAEILAAAQRLHAQAAEGEEEGEEDTVVLVTLGPRGALLVDGAAHREGTWVKCPTVERVVDTSGAGDCLLGSLAAYWGRDMALEEAVGKACAVASLSVQRPGTQTSYPRAEELPAELRLPTSAAGV